MATLHYASGNNFDAQDNFTPAAAGFNLADVTYVDQLNALPDGVQGLVWLNQYSGVTQDFIDAVTPFLGNPRVYGFFLVDEPDPTGQWGTQANAADLRAESDWIHSHDPGAKTFITLMNMGAADNPDYTNTFTPENTHIDLFGVDWYPVWSSQTSINYNMIDTYVAAAVTAGIPVDQIVPTYQTFGGGDWVTEDGSRFVMPTAAQEQQMLDHWASAVPNAAFDYAYAWGSQNGDVALESSPDLQSVFLAHNTSESTSPTDVGTVPPVVPVESASPIDAGSTPAVYTTASTPPSVVDSGNTTSINWSNEAKALSVGDSSHQHQQGLDFSQFDGRGTWSSVGYHQASATTVTENVTADTTSSTDVGKASWSFMDTGIHHLPQIDNHAWHW